MIICNSSHRKLIQCLTTCLWTEDTHRVFPSTSGWCLVVPDLKAPGSWVLTTEASFRAQDAAFPPEMQRLWLGFCGTLCFWIRDFQDLHRWVCIPNFLTLHLYLLGISGVSSRARDMSYAISPLSEWTWESSLVLKYGFWVSIGGICHTDILNVVKDHIKNCHWILHKFLLRWTSQCSHSHIHFDPAVFHGKVKNKPGSLAIPCKIWPSLRTEILLYSFAHLCPFMTG